MCARVSVSVCVCVPHISPVVNVITFMQILVGIKKTMQSYMRELFAKCETNVSVAYSWHACCAWILNSCRRFLIVSIKSLYA